MVAAGAVGIAAEVTLGRRVVSDQATNPGIPASGCAHGYGDPQPATYRLAGANGVGPQLRVPVAPRVRFELGGTGTVTPALAGATVLVESLAADGRTWKEIGRTAVEAVGVFRIGVRVGPGSYRARVPATRGWSQGVSPVVTFG